MSTFSETCLFAQVFLYFNMHKYIHGIRISLYHYEEIKVMCTLNQLPAFLVMIGIQALDPSQLALQIGEVADLRVLGS